jgi:hypothetical protein
MSRPLLIFLGLLTAVAAASVTAVLAHVPGDAYVVTLDPAARSEPASGRVILFFLTDAAQQWEGAQPARGPWWDPPQPIASVAVTDLAPGGSVTIERGAVTSGFDLDELSGRLRVQAVLDADRTERHHLEGPGNVVSESVAVTLGADRPDRVELRLTRAIKGPAVPPEAPNLKWVELPSRLLSTAAQRPVVHRAGVALPRAYLAEEAAGGDAPRHRWPVIYVIPGFGGRFTDAGQFARMLATDGMEEIAPMAVHVVLDPESPLGHHGFVDAPNHGPRGTALVRELIPHLETLFRIDPRREARIVTGHSSGGWSSLWLQLQWPEVFGACWSTSPDPLDFRAFQMSDLYADESVFVDAAGHEQPSYRRLAKTDSGTEVVMTVRQESDMEFAMSPEGASGEQWDAWAAMFSPRDRHTGLPRRMFDPRSGTIDDAVVAHWAQFDVTRIVDADWPRYGPIVTQRVRLLCGELDSFYLERAVLLFQETVERRAALSGEAGPGYVAIVPEATHDNLHNKVFQRINQEMRDYLAGAGYAWTNELAPPK